MNNKEWKNLKIENYNRKDKFRERKEAKVKRIQIRRDGKKGKMKWR